MLSTCIIAEIGVNHNGSVKLAMDLVDICADAGVDIVKFQTFSAERLVSKDAPKADYQIKWDGSGKQFEMLKGLELSESDHRALKRHCVKKEVEFLSTGFDEIDLAMLVKLGIKRIKIPSGEMNNLPLLRVVAGYQLPVLMSTGMASLQEVEKSVAALFQSGLPENYLTILHCTSSYPAPDEDLNLNAIATLKKHFGLAVGYSDHSVGIEASFVAASLGATVIEKHVTLDRNLPGPDHQSSIEPGELRELVRFIRRKDTMMGSGAKKPTSNELANADIARKSIVAKQNIKKGDLLHPENICTKRPGKGLSPMHWDEIIGSKAVKDYVVDEKIIKGNKEDD